MTSKRIIFLLGIAVIIFFIIRLFLNPIFLIEHIGNIWGVVLPENLAVNTWYLNAFNLVIGACSLFIWNNIVFSSKKKRNQAIGLFIGVGFLLYMGIGFLTRNYSTDKCCASNLNHNYVFTSCGLSIHPEYGTEVVECTKRILGIMRGLKKIAPQKISINSRTNFFNSDGANVWFFRNDDGKVEFFDKNGIHPQYGRPLKPVTTDIVREALNQLKAEEKTVQKLSERPYKREKIGLTSSKKNTNEFVPNTSKNSKPKETITKTKNDDSFFNYKNTSLTNELAIYIFNERLNVDHNAVSYLSEKLNYNVVGTIINPAKLSRVLKRQLAMKNIQPLLDKGVSSSVDFICLGLVSEQTDRNSRNMITSRVQLSYQVLDSKSGNVVHDFSKSSSGVGFSEQESIANAYSKF